MGGLGWIERVEIPVWGWSLFAGGGDGEVGTGRCVYQSLNKPLPLNKVHLSILPSLALFCNPLEYMPSF